MCRGVMARAFSVAALTRACWITVLAPAVIRGTCRGSAALGVGSIAPAAEADRGECVAVEPVRGVVRGGAVDAHDRRERFVVEEGDQQMLGADPPVAAATCLVLRVLDGRPRCLGESFKHPSPASRTWRAPTGA